MTTTTTMTAALLVFLLACASNEDGGEPEGPYVQTDDGELVLAGDRCSLDETGDSWTCHADDGLGVLCKRPVMIVKCGGEDTPCIVHPGTCATVTCRCP